MVTTNRVRVNILLRKINKRHDIVERSQITQGNTNYTLPVPQAPTSTNGMSIDHIIRVRARVLLQRQSTRHLPPSSQLLQNLVRFVQVLPTRSRIAVTTRANMDVLLGRFDLNLVVAKVRPIAVQEV